MRHLNLYVSPVPDGSRVKVLCADGGDDEAVRFQPAAEERSEAGALDALAAPACDVCMDANRIGVDVDDMRLPIREALPVAAELGFRTVELGLNYPELAPRQLTESTARHFVRFARDQGLTLASLTADFPGLRLTDASRVEERVDRTLEVLAVAEHMRVAIVTAATSALTHPESGEPSELAVQALQQIAREAQRRGVIYAIRPAADKPEVMARLLSAVGSGTIRICLDPAALMISGQDPGRLLAAMPQEVVISHARDAVAGTSEHAGCEAVLGQGDVDWSSHLALLEAGGYSGPHIVRRLTSASRIGDLREGLAFLRGLSAR